MQDDFDNDEFFDDDFEMDSNLDEDIFEDEFSESIDYLLENDSEEVEEEIRQHEHGIDVDALIIGTMIFGCASDERAKDRKMKQTHKPKRKRN